MVTLIIILLIIYLPLDGFFLKWLPVSQYNQLIISQIPDALILLSFLGILISRTMNRQRINLIGYNTDVIFLGFLVLINLVPLVTGADLFTTIINQKALVRYILLIYIVLNIQMTPWKVKWLIRALVFIFIAEMLIGVAELISPTAAFFFLPQVFTESIGGVEVLSLSQREYMRFGDIFGTMDKTIEYGMFLLVGLILWIAHFFKTPRKYWIGAVIFMVMIYFSGSRSAFFTGIFILLIHQYFRGKVVRKMVYAFLLIPVILIVILFVDINFTDNQLLFAFTSKYLDIARKQRLGIILVMLPAFFSSSFWGLLFGFTADRAFLLDRFGSIPDRPVLLWESADQIEDVYWVALLYYYGIFGFLLFLTFLYKLWVPLRSSIRRYGQHFENPIVISAVLLLAASLPLNLFNQAFEVRTYSFYLWLMVGLALVEIRNARRNQKNRPQIEDGISGNE